jgi:hypothetical protein
MEQSGYRCNTCHDTECTFYKDREKDRSLMDGYGRMMTPSRFTEEKGCASHTYFKYYIELCKKDQKEALNEVKELQQVARVGNVKATGKKSTHIPHKKFGTPLTLDFGDVDHTILLFCAFRYALGRQTYVVGSVAGILKENWDHMHPIERAKYKQEIREAIANKRAGSVMIDVPEWEAILALED